MKWKGNFKKFQKGGPLEAEPSWTMDVFRKNRACRQKKNIFYTGGQDCTEEWRPWLGYKKTHLSLSIPPSGLTVNHPCLPGTVVSAHVDCHNERNWAGQKVVTAQRTHYSLWSESRVLRCYSLGFSILSTLLKWGHEGTQETVCDGEAGHIHFEINHRWQHGSSLKEREEQSRKSYCDTLPRDNKGLNKSSKGTEQPPSQGKGSWEGKGGRRTAAGV